MQQFVVISLLHDVIRVLPNLLCSVASIHVLPQHCYPVEVGNFFYLICCLGHRFNRRELNPLAVLCSQNSFLLLTDRFVRLRRLKHWHVSITRNSENLHWAKSESPLIHRHQCSTCYKINAASIIRSLSF